MISFLKNGPSGWGDTILVNTTFKFRAPRFSWQNLRGKVHKAFVGFLMLCVSCCSKQCVAGKSINKTQNKALTPHPKKAEFQHTKSRRGGFSRDTTHNSTFILSMLFIFHLREGSLGFPPIRDKLPSIHTQLSELHRFSKAKKGFQRHTVFSRGSQRGAHVDTDPRLLRLCYESNVHAPCWLPPV